MSLLSYEIEQLAGALKRFSPIQQVYFGLGLCERLLSIYSIHGDAAPLRTVLHAVRTCLSDPASKQLEQHRADADTEMSHIVSSGIAPWEQECLHAFRLLLDLSVASDDQDQNEQSLQTILDLLLSSREAVELVAFHNLRLVAWDRTGDEKVRQHPLVQSEIQAIYADLQRIWNLDKVD